MRMAACICMLVAASAVVHGEEVYLGVGTTGWVVGGTHSFDFPAALRIEANGLDYSRSVDTTDINYDGKLKLVGGSLLFDVFPLGQSSFRLTGGIVVSNNRITAVAVPRNGTFTINGQTVPATGESITFTARQPKVQPYLGLGFGHTRSKGWGFFFDLGATYGNPKVDLTATPGLVLAVGQANVDAEKQSVQDKADKFRFYPVVKLGWSYTF